MYYAHPRDKNTWIYLVNSFYSPTLAWYVRFVSFPFFLNPDVFCSSNLFISYPKYFLFDLEMHWLSRYSFRFLLPMATLSYKVQHKKNFPRHVCDSELQFMVTGTSLSVWLTPDLGFEGLSVPEFNISLLSPHRLQQFLNSLFLLQFSDTRFLIHISNLNWKLNSFIFYCWHIQIPWQIHIIHRPCESFFLCLYSF